MYLKAWGWKIKESTLPIYEHKELEVTYKGGETCRQELPQKLDKICIGVGDQVDTLCRGELGSGFVVRNVEEDSYYLHGVASISPDSSTRCQRNILMTNISFYYDFIDSVLSKNK